MAPSTMSINKNIHKQQLAQIIDQSTKEKLDGTTIDGNKQKKYINNNWLKLLASSQKKTQMAALALFTNKKKI